MNARPRSVPVSPDQRSPDPAGSPASLPERDEDQPYGRIATDPPPRRAARRPTARELEAAIRADPSTSPAAISWLDHIDQVRRERGE